MAHYLFVYDLPPSSVRRYHVTSLVASWAAALDDFERAVGLPVAEAHIQSFEKLG